MNPKTRIRSQLAAITVSALALAGFAGSAVAASPAPTKVTIQAESGGFFGTVKSARTACKAERHIVVYKQAGAKQSPATDKRVATDTTDAAGKWDLGNPGLHSGRYYARATRTPQCLAANSITLRAQQ